MRRWLETGLAGRVRAPKWSVRRTDTSGPTPLQNSDCQADVRRFRAITGPETAVHQLSRTHECALGGAHLLYFSNTFSICPTFFSTLPAFFSALPSPCKLGLFVTLPAVSLTLPFTS